MSKRRPDIIILMDILTALLDGPNLPTRLAQVCNLSYDNFVRFAKVLEAKGLVEKKMEDGHEFYSLSPVGFQQQQEFRKVIERFGV